MKLQFTPSARDQFLSAVAYIQVDNSPAARRFRERAESALRELERFPDSGRRFPEYPQLPHRELVVRPYRFIYRVVGETVWILAVWPGRRRMEVPH